ncbi:adenylate/guanylate cyclase domain-containing protein [Agriterribacter sp.]|jgi:class 3 adenylate cyclase|uniref:adenylate/guanylate cyclase domain-containing protein n=1 Tax=Agriterribacter sp. TaxID=2821509 RepID=UPI002C676CE7|nr:adenylate/guanylate cyclase domain-containing protein [Agriterribacter sp.]HRO46767.1 adenylate/guanylate cyclase domain-containing protein [Agriterribacter sp.]
MKEKLYKNYVDDIAHYLRQGKKDNLEKGFGYGQLNEKLASHPKMLWSDKTKNEANFRSLGALNTVTGLNAKYEEKLGAHPGFSHLKTTNGSEYHYIVSMFADVRNSTGLFKKYDPDVVANICRTIQLAAIHTCWYFDGYVHRLQGDGLMVYFGGKGTTKQKAVDNALMAASFISYFVKNDLRNLFEEQGVNRIYTRIGIDFGDDKDTLWHNAGIGECSEVTTTSLHTSLACKMQAQAESNGVVVGDNILSYKSTHKDYFVYKKYKKNGDEQPYVYEIPDEGFRYKQHDFSWEKYLKNHPQIQEDEEGNLVFIGPSIIPNIGVQQNINYLQQNVTGYKPYLK